MDTNKKLRIALVGAGGIGKRWANAVQKTKGAVLSVVCDTDEGKARVVAAAHDGCAVFPDWRMCAVSQNIDVAIVALPNALLASVSQGFLKNKKHVLCEKPGGIVPEEIAKNIALAKKNRARYMVGFNHRYHDGFQKARKLFEEGIIGDIVFIRARYGFGGREGYEKEWRFNKAISGGGELIDQGVHMIDMARWFLGNVVEVKSMTSDGFWHGGVEDNAFVLLKNKKGATSSIHVSWTQWRALHSFEIYGTKGYLVIDGLGKKYGGGERLIFGKRNKSFTADEKVIACNTDADRSLARMLQEFISAINEGRETTPSGRDGLETLKIVHEIYGSKKR